MPRVTPGPPGGKRLPVDFDPQILPGRVAHARGSLSDHARARTACPARDKNDDAGAAACAPAGSRASCWPTAGGASAVARAPPPAASRGGPRRRRSLPAPRHPPGRLRRRLGRAHGQALGPGAGPLRPSGAARAREVRQRWGHAPLPCQPGQQRQPQGVPAPGRAAGERRPPEAGHPP